MAPRDFCYSDDNAVCDELGPADHESCRFLRGDSVMRQGAGFVGGSQVAVDVPSPLSYPHAVKPDLRVMLLTDRVDVFGIQPFRRDSGWLGAVC